MKSLLYILSIFLLYTTASSQFFKQPYPSSNEQRVTLSTSGGAVTYIKFSKSINGPFESPKTINAGDSLFMKLDVTPAGTVYVEYIFDINENGIIDPEDFAFGGQNFIDNDPNDLDPTAGIIVSFISAKGAPSFQVIARGTEGVTVAEGILRFQNPPAQFTLSGYVYDPYENPVPGAWVFADDGSIQIGDASNETGFYSIPLNAGTYQIYIEAMGYNYAPFETTMVVTGNTIQNFYLSDLNAYIRGFVRDENLNPIPNVGVGTERGGGTRTDSNGEYLLMVPSGEGYIGLNDDDLLPNYLQPDWHYYEISENDSIVNNEVSNFICYSTNSTITGTVTEDGHGVSRAYLIWGRSDQLQSMTRAISNRSGMFELPVHRDTMIYYSVMIADWDDEYPIPPGMYSDTMHWNVTPGSTVNFNIISAETAFVDLFDGDNISPGPMWQWHGFGDLGGPWPWVFISEDRLKVTCTSQSGRSGIGVVTQKPFRIQDREYRISVNKSEMFTSNNSVYMVLSGRREWGEFENFQNSLQLIWEKTQQGVRQWKLVKISDRNSTTLWNTPDNTDSNTILWQFIGVNLLVLKIDDNVVYSGAWGSHLSIAYVYLVETNETPNLATPVYFDGFAVGAIGTTVGVREIHGEIPKEFELSQNYPNPFNPVTSIKYQVSAESYVTLKVFNQLGQEVAVPVNEVQKPGVFQATLNLSALPSGIYYYRLVATDLSNNRLLMNSTKKAILIK
ncbi:MAG: carboxypeptidase regulatory-like domain-containing protein [Bacteroidota bacterium]|nr:carboxypeptidase regulatory-like domain-containing protein [Bacteroidota bacterium]